MATATERPRQTANGTDKPVKSLLEQVIEQSSNDKVRQVNGYLTDDARIAAIEEALPDFMKGQAKRLVKRAVMTFADKEALQKCTPQSFVKCVQQAAELGFAIDGRLCHAVPYNTKVKIDGKEVWIDVAQLQVDYKGMIACAKRLKLVQDVWARLVYEHDSFDLTETDGKVHYNLSLDHTKDRGEVLGAFAVATHQDGWFRLEWMSLTEINDIRKRSKSYQSHIAKGYQTPWVSDAGEMQKKTVIKRLLKTFSDDPGLIRMLELDDQDIDLDTVIAETERRQMTAESLRTKLAPRKIVESEAVDELPETSYEPKQEAPAEGMTTLDRFKAECLECELIGAVDLVVEKWQGVDMSEADWAACQEFAKTLQQKMRDARGKK